MRNKLVDYLFLFSVAGLIIGFDQWTKWLVKTNLAIGEFWAPWPWIEPYARFVNWQNTGAAFGIFQGMNEVFKVLAIIVSGIIIYYFPQVPKEDYYLRLPMAMQLGGAVGNLIDRFVDGYVTDFVSVGTFAVFNVADASISVGVALLFLSIFWRDWQAKKHPDQEAGADIPDSSEPSADPEIEPVQTLPAPQPEKVDGEVG